MENLELYIMGAMFLDRLLEELPKETPIVGKYKGGLRWIIRKGLKAVGKKG